MLQAGGSRRSRSRALAGSDRRFLARSPARPIGSTPPRSPHESLRGKVVLVDFWTYSCINCLRTLPYLRAWAEKYKERRPGRGRRAHARVRLREARGQRASRRRRTCSIGFPVADRQRLRHLARLRQPLLAGVLLHRCARAHPPSAVRRGATTRRPSGSSSSCSPSPAGLASRPTWSRRKAQGIQAAAGRDAVPCPARPTSAMSARTTSSRRRGIVRDRVHAYPGASSLRTNEWTLSGDWVVERERAVLSRANGRIAYRFHARDLHLVLGPSADGKPVRFKVLRGWQAAAGRPRLRHR